MKFWIQTAGVLMLAAVAAGPGRLGAQAAGAGAAAQAARPDQDYAGLYGKAEVAVTVASGGRTSNAWLLGVQGGELELRPADAADAGERVFIPIGDIQEFKLSYKYPVEMQNALDLLDDEGPAPEPLLALRRYVWPLAAYLPLPEDRLNIHRPVEVYLDGLIECNQLDEAYALVLEIPLGRVDPKWIQLTLRLAERLVAAGMNTRALSLLGVVPLKAEDEAFIDLFIRFAGILRAQDNLDEALILYDRLRALPDHRYYRQAVLWTAYCNVRLGRTESARLFLAQVAPVEPRDPEFSLYQLVLARVGLEKENFAEAMEQISQGVVFSRIGYEWVPEMLFTSGLCYESLGNPDTARTLYDQLELFFPSNLWTERGRTRREALPPPKPPAPAAEAAAPAA